MTKDVYYFSHDSNAHKDPKVLKLRMKFGWEGYGIYWAIVETLREQKDYKWKSSDRELISYSFANGEPIIQEVVDHCIEVGLLIDDGEYIYSDSLLKRMNIYEEKRRKRIEAGRKGARKRWGDSVSKGNHRQSDSNAISEPMATDGKGKESKVKESKDIIPYSEIVSFLNEKAGKKYRPTTPKTKTLIQARWNEGFVVDDFKKVIETKCGEWLNDENMSRYLRPETLFGTKFEGYLNESVEHTPVEDESVSRNDRIRELKMSLELGEEYYRKFESIEMYEDIKKELEELEQL